VRFQLWIDAVEMARAERLPATWKSALRMMKTDSYILVFMFRVRRLFMRAGVPLIDWPIRVVQQIFGGIELGSAIALGSGVYFVHSRGTVIGGTSRIGNRVRFMGNNTVGTARDNGYPVIEDDAEIGCGARVLGPVRIGARAKIGANAVVIEDVPADSVAVGIPARIIRPSARAAAPSLQLVVNGEIAR
jgi:serine O-acetyltransferase